MFIPLSGESQFLIPPKNYEFQFPKDHGSHPGYRIEWWYITGHLNAQSQSTGQTKKLGIQVTFFRVGQSPDDAKVQSKFFKNDHFHVAHMALSDLSEKKFYHEEKLNRNGWDAWAKEGILNCRNGNWSLKQNQESNHFSTQLQSSISDHISFNIQFNSQKPPVIFGKDGVSIKGAAESARSLYITFPRLQTTGEITIDGQPFVVDGETWMDHEISSSQLDPNQVGWNWASIHLDSGESIMVYMMRTKNDTKDLYSTFNFIASDNQTVKAFPASHFEWLPKNYWKSPMTGVEYPVDSIIKFRENQSNIPTHIRLVPLMNDQEMESKITQVQYWEGACKVVDQNGKQIGKAYVELTGYGASLTPLLSN